MKTDPRLFIAAGIVGLMLGGCKSGAQSTSVAGNPSILPLPPIEREVLPDGSEVVAAPPADGETAPRKWTRRFTDFCTPKPPPKCQSDRVYESDNVPYSS